MRPGRAAEQRSQASFSAFGTCLFLRFHMLAHTQTHTQRETHTRAYLEILKMRYKDTFGLPTILAALRLMGGTHDDEQQDGQPFKEPSHSQFSFSVLAVSQSDSRPRQEPLPGPGSTVFLMTLEMCASRPAEIYTHSPLAPLPSLSFSCWQNVH